MNCMRGVYRITTDPSMMDSKKVYEYLRTYSYWASTRTLETVARSMDHSLNFGVLKKDILIGYARVVTDLTTFAWLCDVIIIPEERGNGLGKWLVECITTHPDLLGVRRFLLATRDAHSLYKKYGGFNLIANPERWMEKINPDAV